MAFLKTAQLLMKPFIKSEIIFNNIIKQNVSNSIAVNKYLEEIRNYQINQNNTNVLEFLSFPRRTFHKLNKICLENLINDSYNIIKEKGLCTNALLYNALFDCYCNNDINFDIEYFLKDMKENQVSLNEHIAGKIIKYLSSGGKMNTVEILLDEIKAKNISLYLKEKYYIVSGYIIAGQPEKSEIFIKENKLNVEIHLYFSRSFGYASIGDVNNLKNILAEMKEKNLKFLPNQYYDLYERLIHANVEKSNLNEIIDVTKANLLRSSSQLYSLITVLNSADHFNYSVFIIGKLINLVKGPMGYISLFGISKCPVNTFKEALRLLLPLCRNTSLKRNIFADINFDKALDVSQSFSKTENWKIIYYSLINKAIDEKSLPLVEKILDFTFINLPWSKINLLLQQVFLPSMLTSGMVLNYEEILDKFPAFRNHILPAVLMSFLCSGEFARYNELLSKETYIKTVNGVFDWKYLAMEIRNSLTLKEVKKWMIEAKKCFPAILIDEILRSFFIMEMIKLLKRDSLNEIEELIDYTKELDLEFTQACVNYLTKEVPNHTEFIRSSIAVKNGDSRQGNVVLPD